MTEPKKTRTRRSPPSYKVELRGKKFQCTMVWDGQRKRPTFPTADAAHAWGAEQVTRLLQGLPMNDPVDFIPRQKDEDGEGKPVTMQQLLEYTVKWHWNRKGPNGGPMPSAETLIKSGKDCVKALGASTNFRALTRTVIMNKLDAYQKARGNGGATTNRRISALSVMFKNGMKEWQGWAPPILEKTQEDNARDFRIPPKLEEDILLYWLARSDIDMYDFTVLAIQLGQRKNEIARVRGAQSTAHKRDGYIDGDYAIFPMQIGKTKGTFERSVPLRPTVQEVVTRRLAMLAKPTDRLFPEGFNNRNFNKKWEKMVAHFYKEGHPEVLDQQKEHQTPGQEFVPHACRHEFCSRLGDAGFNLGEIKQYSGHKTDAQAARYVKDNKVALRMRQQRDGKFDPTKLPGGEVPAFAPSLTNNVVQIAGRTRQPTVMPAAAPAVAPAAQSEQEKVAALVAALEALGLSHELVIDALKAKK